MLRYYCLYFFSCAEIIFLSNLFCSIICNISDEEIALLILFNNKLATREDDYVDFYHLADTKQFDPAYITAIFDKDKIRHDNNNN